jgi:hypothetical protein
MASDMLSAAIYFAFCKCGGPAVDVRAGRTTVRQSEHLHPSLFQSFDVHSALLATNLFTSDTESTVFRDSEDNLN